MIRFANIDENNIDRKLFGDFLKSRGYSFDLYSSGVLLLGALNIPGIYYDVIVLNWDLLDLNCISLIELLNGCQIGLIIVSHEGIDNQIQSGLCYKIYDRDVFFLEKPIDFIKLIEFVNQKKYFNNGELR